MTSQFSPSRRRQIVGDPENAENVDPNIPSSVVIPKKKPRHDGNAVESSSTSSTITQNIDSHTESPGSVNPSPSGNEIFVAWLEAKFGPPTAEPRKKTKKRPRKEKVPTVPKKRLTKMEKVDKMLSEMGVDPETSSFCVKAAIYKGIIKITGDPAELKMVVHEGVASCGHYIEATLEDVLKQPDYVSGTGFGLLNVDEREALLNDSDAYKTYEEDKRATLKKARTVVCKEKTPRDFDDFITWEDETRLNEKELEELVDKREEEGRAVRYMDWNEMRDVQPRDCSNGKTRYTVLNLCCSGPAFRDPEFSDYFGHKHCKKCLKGFGQCIYYKNEHCYICGKHYHMRGKCDCIKKKKEKARRREINRLHEEGMWEQARELSVYRSIYSDSDSD